MTFKITDSRRILIVPVDIKCKSLTKQLSNGLKVLKNLQLKSKQLIFGRNSNGRHPSWGDTAINQYEETLFKWTTPHTTNGPLSEKTRQRCQMKLCKTLPGMPNHFLVELNKIDLILPVAKASNDHNKLVHPHLLGRIQIRESTKAEFETSRKPERFRHERFGVFLI